MGAIGRKKDGKQLHKGKIPALTIALCKLAEALLATLQSCWQQLTVGFVHTKVGA